MTTNLHRFRSLTNALQSTMPRFMFLCLTDVPSHSLKYSMLFVTMASALT